MGEESLQSSPTTLKKLGEDYFSLGRKLGEEGLPKVKCDKGPPHFPTLKC
jgi:hypothetical protein